VLYCSSAQFHLTKSITYLKRFWDSGDNFPTSKEDQFPKASQERKKGKKEMKERKERKKGKKGQKGKKGKKGKKEKKGKKKTF